MQLEFIKGFIAISCSIHQTIEENMVQVKLIKGKDHSQRMRQIVNNLISNWENILCAIGLGMFTNSCNTKTQHIFLQSMEDSLVSTFNTLNLNTAKLTFSSKGQAGMQEKIKCTNVRKKERNKAGVLKKKNQSQHSRN